jgi:predicted CxxxxCH...CXXCH cytochrome family protein
MMRKARSNGKYGMASGMGLTVIMTAVFLIVIALPAEAQTYTITSCGGCHGYPPLDSTTRNSPPGAVVGDHQVHSYACSTCHVAPATTTSADFGHRNGAIEMQPGATAIDGGYYDKDNSGGYSAADATFPQTNNPVTQSCRNVSCHGATATPQWGVGTTTCSDCHGGVVKGVRRTVSGAAGDFSKTSTHTTGTNTPAKSTCQACHGNHLGLGLDPNAALLNGDTGAAVTFNGTGASVEAFCVSCHDANGAARLAAPADPFGADGVSPVNISWTLGSVAHSQAANANKCLACHGNAAAAGTTLDPFMNAHGSSQPKLMRYTYNSADSVIAATNVCYNCHGTTPANGAVDAIQAQFNLTGGRHSTIKCSACHDQHRALPGSHTPGSAALAGVLSGVSGSNPTFGATNWAGAASLSTANPADSEYKICFKCHAAAGTAVTPLNPGSGAGTAAAAFTNLAMEFSPNNLSGHPVVTGLNNYPNSTAPKALTAAKMKAPWNVNLGTQVMTCSDCHATSSTASKGPHGSSVKWMLAGTNKAWPYTATTANGTSTGTLFRLATYNTGDGTANGLFCLNCHTIRPASGGNNWHINSNTTGGQHGGSAIMACVSCHVRVPHGGKISRLLQTTNAPARYQSNGNGATSSFTQFGPTTGTIKGSTVSSSNFNSSCGEHSGTGGEAW